MTEPTVLQVATTVDSADAAQALAAGIVEQRLAACVQIDGPILSTYRWQGKVTTDEEWRLTCKTTPDRYTELAQWITDHHSYDVPEILATPVFAGHEPYIRWVRDETRDATV